ncbi:interleukin-5 receptor subunit alpha-like [Electrophorus electricus]|uniref:Fibronectin type-III domain-containing protein n=1 Tax=Electrophorus electricus TaxID=8005 RepID=A0A4W4FHG5_ELEEL|nr:interleukin-5 receptor subunit alpha-like [Electrophorus electricus]
MKLFRVLLSLFLVLADYTDNVSADKDCYFDHSNYEGNLICDDQEINFNSEDQACGYLGLQNFSVDDISCMIYKSEHINCSWSTQTLPKTAQYSASFRFECKDVDHPLHCLQDTAKESIECQSNFSIHSDMLVLVNISMPGHWFALEKAFYIEYIEKLDPPEITTALNQPGYLEINWSMPKNIKNLNDWCFTYEIKINNETVQLTHRLAYNKTKIDPTKCYRIQMRTKVGDDCAEAKYWSEWSAVVEVGPSENPHQLNIVMIASIVFVLPMVLLALLLVCKFQRLSEKLFPSVPTPSGNVKMLLERDDFSHVMPPKHVEWMSEGEIIQVTS